MASFHLWLIELHPVVRSSIIALLSKNFKEKKFEYRACNLGPPGHDRKKYFSYWVNGLARIVIRVDMIYAIISKRTRMASICMACVSCSMRFPSVNPFYISFRDLTKKWRMICLIFFIAACSNSLWRPMSIFISHWTSCCITWWACGWL